jgi:hypothetical protein
MQGLDPERLLHETWVERVSLPLLLSGRSDALLSFEELRERVPDVLADDGPARPDADDLDFRQRRPLALHVQVTGLRGLTYPVRGLRRDAPLAGTTYADWGRFELEPGAGLDQMLAPSGRSPLDFALASAASPGGFAPELLDRRPDADAYERHGIENFPESGRVWYTDGGLLGSQPLGRVIAAGRALHRSEEDATRVHLLVDPRSESASVDVWSDPDARPTWQAGASRALAILSEQSLFDDLRRIEKDNSRIEWAERLAGLLAERLDGDAAGSLREFLAEVRSEREGMRADEPHRDQAHADADGGDLAGLLRLALCEIGGLVGKERVAIDVISPLVLGERDDDVGSLLAGEFMGDFGGFLSRQLRASDFGLGYESAIAWLDQGLRACELEDDVVDRTLSFVQSKRRYGADATRSGEAELSDLSLRDRMQLVRLGAHLARVLAVGAVDLRSRIPDRLGRAIDRARDSLPSGPRQG